MFETALIAVVALQVAVLLFLAAKRRSVLVALYIGCLGMAWLLALSLVSAHLTWGSHVVWLVPVAWLVVAICLTLRSSGPPAAAAELKR